MDMLKKKCATKPSTLPTHAASLHTKIKRLTSLHTPLLTNYSTIPFHNRFMFAQIYLLLCRFWQCLTDRSVFCNAEGSVNAKAFLVASYEKMRQPERKSDTAKTVPPISSVFIHLAWYVYITSINIIS